MEEVTQNCDTIIVMRDGAYLWQPNLLRNIAWSRLSAIWLTLHYGILSRPPPGEVLLEVKHFEQPEFSMILTLIGAGEIWVFAGLMGSGRTEIMRAVFGVDPHAGGELVFAGRA